MLLSKIRCSSDALRVTFGRFPLGAAVKLKWREGRRSRASYVKL